MLGFSNSFIYRNLSVICKNFGWLVDDFLVGSVNLCHTFFGTYHRNTVFATVDTRSTLLRELVSLKDGHLFLDGDCQLTRSELQCIIDCVCWLLFGFFIYLFILELVRVVRVPT